MALTSSSTPATRGACHSSRPVPAPRCCRRVVRTAAAIGLAIPTQVIAPRSAISNVVVFKREDAPQQPLQSEVAGRDFSHLMDLDDDTVFNRMQDAMTYRMLMGLAPASLSAPDTDATTSGRAGFNLKQVRAYRDNVTRNLAPTVAQGFATAVSAAGFTSVGPSAVNTLMVAQHLAAMPATAAPKRPSLTLNARRVQVAVAASDETPLPPSPKGGAPIARDVRMHATTDSGSEGKAEPACERAPPSTSSLSSPSGSGFRRRGSAGRCSALAGAGRQGDAAGSAAWL